jgi:hypothetical protein
VGRLRLAHPPHSDNKGVDNMSDYPINYNIRAELNSQCDEASSKLQVYIPAS